MFFPRIYSRGCRFWHIFGSLNFNNFVWTYFVCTYAVDWQPAAFLKMNSTINHCVKSVQIRSYSGTYFPVFGLNTENYGVNLPIQSEYRKIRTRNNFALGHFSRNEPFVGISQSVSKNCFFRAKESDCEYGSLLLVNFWNLTYW